MSPSICGPHIHFNLPEALYQHDIFQDAGRGLAVHIGQHEAVAVQVDPMNGIRPIVGEQAMALAFPSFRRRRVFIEAGAVDGPAVEAALATVDLPETLEIISSGCETTRFWLGNASWMFSVALAFRCRPGRSVREKNVEPF